MSGAPPGEIAPIDIKIERVRQRLTQAEVADRAGVDQSTVSDVENGKGSTQTIAAVARALGLIQ